jgi:hypothetical protein
MRQRETAPRALLLLPNSAHKKHTVVRLMVSVSHVLLGTAVTARIGLYTGSLQVAARVMLSTAVMKARRRHQQTACLFVPAPHQTNSMWPLVAEGAAPGSIAELASEIRKPGAAVLDAALRGGLGCEQGAVVSWHQGQ